MKEKKDDDKTDKAEDALFEIRMDGSRVSLLVSSEGLLRMIDDGLVCSSTCKRSGMRASKNRRIEGRHQVSHRSAPHPGHVVDCARFMGTHQQ
jgi:hypothetical protein